MDDFPRHDGIPLVILAVFEAVILKTETSPMEYMHDVPTVVPYID